MSDEVVIENRSRPTLLTLCGGVWFCSSFMVYASISIQESIVLGVWDSWFSLLVSLSSGWCVFSLLSSRSYLESSPEGIIVGGMIRYYVPWSNIRDIRLGSTVNFLVGISGGALPGKTKPVVLVELINTNDVYFDNALFRRASMLLSRRVITLNAGLLTSIPNKRIYELLHARWIEWKTEEDRTAGG